jgi:8-oxo-dGTP pyrophosphatase MutT (NUDIX family)
VTQWRIHGERSLYESDWVSLRLADVELPDGTRFDHHVIRIPYEVASLVVRDERGFLLLYRHRFITDSWVWEVPAGMVDEGETAAEAAAREALEETGWRPGPVRMLGSYHPTNGNSDQRFHVFAADGAERERDPEPNETERVEWVPAEHIRKLIRDGMTDGLSLTSLLWALSE